MACVPSFPFPMNNLVHLVLILVLALLKCTVLLSTAVVKCITKFSPFSIVIMKGSVKYCSCKGVLFNIAITKCTVN